MVKLIGMIHLPPLPGSPGYRGLTIREYLDYSVKEAEKLYVAGFNGVIIENYMDYPFSIRISDRISLELFSKIVEHVRREFNDFEIGVNILRNSGVEAAWIACVSNADFIRVNSYYEPVLAPEGFLQPIAREIWSVLNTLDCRVKIYADVNVKHAKPLIDIVDALHDTCSRGRVNGVIITGRATGYETSLNDILLARRMCRDKEIWVGSGVNHDNIGSYIDIVDGLIIGTSIKIDGVTSNPIDVNRAKLIVDRARIVENRVQKLKHY